MEATKIWAENKKLITTTALCAFAALLVLKFFDTIFFMAVLVAIVVAVAVYWSHLCKKHGGPSGVYKHVLKEFGYEE